MHCAQPYAAPLKAPHVTRCLHSTVYAFPVEYGSTEIRITVIYNLYGGHISLWDQGCQPETSPIAFD